MLRVMADCVVCDTPVEVGWGPHEVPVCPRCQAPVTGLTPGAVPVEPQRDPLVDRRRR